MTRKQLLPLFVRKHLPSIDAVADKAIDELTAAVKFFYPDFGWTGHADYAIALAPAGLVSRKNIGLSPDGRYSIFHGIDGRVEQLSERELCDETNIGAALMRGAFYLDE